MSLQIAFVWARKIHKWTMWLAILLGVPLSLSGVIMEGESGWRDIFTIEQMLLVRTIHRAISTKFALVLAIMMVTGLAMWAIPKILSKRKI